MTDTPDKVSAASVRKAVREMVSVKANYPHYHVILLGKSRDRYLVCDDAHADKKRLIRRMYRRLGVEKSE